MAMLRFEFAATTPLCPFGTSPPQGGRLFFSLANSTPVRRFVDNQTVQHSPISPLEGEMSAKPTEGGKLTAYPWLAFLPHPAKEAAA